MEGFGLIMLLFMLLGAGPNALLDADDDSERDDDAPDPNQIRITETETGVTVTLPPTPPLNMLFDDDLPGSDDGLLYGTAAPEIISGGLRADYPFAEDVDSTTPNDKLRGFGGDDIIFGGLGDDDIEGNRGNDIVFGGAGNDYVWGDAGDDVLDGGEGTDFLDPGTGTDRAYGGEGDDILRTDDPDSIHLLNGGPGDDVLVADILEGASSQVTLVGGEGDDLFAAGLGPRLVTDFGDDSGGSGDGDTLNNDYLALWQYYPDLSAAQQDLADNGMLTQTPFGDLVLDGVTPADLTEDNTGLSDDPEYFHADIQILFRHGEQTITVAQRPILGGDAFVNMDWGDGNTVGAAEINRSYWTHEFDAPGIYDLTYSVESLHSESADRVVYRIDTVARTVQLLTPDFAT